MVIPSFSEWREMAEWICVTRSLASFVPADVLKKKKNTNIREKNLMYKSSEERYVEAFKK